MSGCSSRTTVFLAKRASTSDADGPKAFPYQVLNQLLNPTGRVRSRGGAPVLLHRVPTRKPCILGLVYTHPPPTRRFSVLLYTHPPPTHAKPAKNTVPIATPTITPTLHPGYTQITPTLHPRAISVCRKNVCKNVCVSNMYVDLYAIQLTVLLLDYCTPAEHPHLHPHPRILPNTHTYTHAISENRVFVIPTPESKKSVGPHLCRLAAGRGCAR